MSRNISKVSAHISLPFGSISSMKTNNISVNW